MGNKQSGAASTQAPDDHTEATTRVEFVESSHLLPASASQDSLANEEMESIIGWQYKNVNGETEQLDFAQLKNTTPTSQDAAAITTGIDVAIPEQQPEVKKKTVHKEHKLSELPATAICGNDIASSCLYVVGVCTSYAGIWSPLCLLMVAILLFLFRQIYSEVGSALPLNGASYTLLLNTTSKMNSSLAACLTLISYVATAVVSGSTALYYIQCLPYCQFVSILWGTIILLAAFALLNLIGIKESSVTAAIIFIVHLITLSILVIYCAVHTVVTDQFATLKQNWFVSATITTSIPSAIFYGFGSAMLGVTGFESSANFIEQQKPGVFPKTLRNMWVVVTIFNPTIAFLSACVLPLKEAADPNNPNILSRMGAVSAGRWLEILVSADAALVLSGAVLTAYVGVTGLIRRMAYDRCMFQFFLAENRFTKTNHWIIIIFFLVCSSMMLILGQSVNNLAGVYTIAFISVMFLFAFGDLMLKYKRGKLRRASRAQKTAIFICMLGCLVALAANVTANPAYVIWFVVYYGGCAALVLLMLMRIKILNVIIFFVYSKLNGYRFGESICRLLIKLAKNVNNQPIMFLTKDDDISILNRAVLYVMENEITDCLKIVHVYNTAEEIPKQLQQSVETLDKIYAKMKIDLVLVKGKFGPGIVEKISEHYDVPKNLMFISCPGQDFAHSLDKFGGLRIIVK